MYCNLHLYSFEISIARIVLCQGLLFATFFEFWLFVSLVKFLTLNFPFSLFTKLHYVGWPFYSCNVIYTCNLQKCTCTMPLYVYNVHVTYIYVIQCTVWYTCIVTITSCCNYIYHYNVTCSYTCSIYNVTWNLRDGNVIHMYTCTMVQLYTGHCTCMKLTLYMYSPKLFFIV